MSNPAIILEGNKLMKSFVSGDRTLSVLTGIDLTLVAGESVSIRGESGSGKSTLLHVLAGLDSPDQGELWWAGKPDTGAVKRGKFLGMVFQSFYLIPELTALDNVIMAARMLGGVGAKEKSRAKLLLERVGLGERLDHVPAKLSGGERQRVAVARALMNRPQLILADEPTGNLDETTGNAVISLLLDLCQETGTALVLVTHNLGHAAKTDRKLVMKRGALEETSPVVVSKTL